MIETERLFLRPFDKDDLDIVLKLYSDEDVTRYTPFPVMDRAMAQKRLEQNIAGWQLRPQINYEMAVVKKETNEKIGRAEITRYNAEDSAMVGWMLVKDEWGRGYATEIANALVGYCFHTLHTHRAFALCHPENVGSWRVMEKCGMHREAHYIRKCKYIKADGIHWEDELEYAVLSNCEKES